jgi:mannose-6-phosphate isomerase-like protein (cupin superfamily)
MSSNSQSSVAGRLITVNEGLARLPGPEGQRFAELFKHGTLSVEIYSPVGTDQQNPHVKDEIYVVVRGAGEFVLGDQRQRFEAGDFLFVPAGLVHRFEQFTNVIVWVIFYGPEGGEHPATLEFQMNRGKRRARDSASTMEGLVWKAGSSLNRADLKRFSPDVHRICENSVNVPELASNRTAEFGVRVV